jgi:glycosyltransferase involved in cell wall biosynthesis
MAKPIGVSIAVMAFNEEKNIGPTLEGIIHEIPKVTQNYEIIVIDDGSSDNTGKIADTYAEKNHKIKIIHHHVNKRFGYSFKEGVKIAKKEYIIGFPGDNDTSPVSLRNIILQAKDNYIINSYTSNPNARSLFRIVISKFFVILMNFLFQLNLKYYNGSFICKVSLLKNLNLKSKGLAIYAEAKVRLLKKGYKYEDVPFEHIKRKFGKSSAVSITSLIDTISTVYELVKDIYLVKTQ